MARALLQPFAPVSANAPAPPPITDIYNMRTPDLPSMMASGGCKENAQPGETSASASTSKGAARGVTNTPGRGGGSPPTTTTTFASPAPPSSATPSGSTALHSEMRAALLMRLLQAEEEATRHFEELERQLAACMASSALPPAATFSPLTVPSAALAPPTPAPVVPTSTTAGPSSTPSTTVVHSAGRTDSTSSAGGIDGTAGRPVSPDAVTAMFLEEGAVAAMHDEVPAEDSGGVNGDDRSGRSSTLGEETVVLDLGAMLMGVLTVSNGTPTHIGATVGRGLASPVPLAYPQPVPVEQTGPTLRELELEGLLQASEDKVRELIALNHALCDAADELEHTVNGEHGVAALVQCRDELATKNAALEAELADAKKREVQLQKALVDLKSKSDTRLSMAKQAVKDTEDEITALERVLSCALCVVRSHCERCSSEGVDVLRELMGQLEATLVCDDQ